MRTVSIQELRDNLSQIVEETAIAEKKFTVTKFGRPKVKIVPLHLTDIRDRDRQKKDLRKSPLFGIWKDRQDMADSADWVTKLREEEDFHRVSL